MLKTYIAIAALAALAMPAAALGGPAERLADEVAGVERLFEARVAALGVVPAFREFVADKAIMFLPDPIEIKPRLAKANWPGVIKWRPDFIAVSGDGNLAVSIGPSAWTTDGVVDPGYYLTVWERQSDRSLKFVVDRGTVMKSNLHAEPAAKTEVLIPATAARRSSAALPETELAAQAAKVGWRAVASMMDSRGRLLRDGVRPSVGPDAATKLEAGAVSMRPMVTRIAGSGDLGYAYGEARWREGDKDKRGYYVRVWQRRPAGWRIVVDHFQLHPGS